MIPVQLQLNRWPINPVIFIFFFWSNRNIFSCSFTFWSKGFDRVHENIHENIMNSPDSVKVSMKELSIHGHFHWLLSCPLNIFLGQKTQNIASLYVQSHSVIPMKNKSFDCHCLLLICWMSALLFTSLDPLSDPHSDRYLFYSSRSLISQINSWDGPNIFCQNDIVLKQKMSTHLNR